MFANVLLRTFLIPVVLFLLTACAPQGPHLITPGGDIIEVELAVTMEEKTKGLMGRESMPADAGMLFVFDQPQPVSFWMKNTLIPLDAVYMDETGTIVDIKNMVPCPPEEANCPSYPAAVPVQYALEINGGRAQELGLKVGDQLQLNLASNNDIKK